MTIDKGKNSFFKSQIPLIKSLIVTSFLSQMESVLDYQIEINKAFPFPLMVIAFFKNQQRFFKSHFLEHKGVIIDNDGFRNGSSVMLSGN
jgi:hypothetical protein